MSSLPHIVLPGQLVTTDAEFMRGHGTLQTSDGALYSTLAGTVQRINKLLTVSPLKSRFLGDIGDVVVGRITEVGHKRWSVDVRGRQDAGLLLSAINLPGGIQRRKQQSDELQMRSFFNVGEIICAEVQNIHADGAVSIHTRNYKYGKLCTGTLVWTQPALIKRAKSAFWLAPWGVELILAINGAVWIGKPRRTAAFQAADGSDAFLDDADLQAIYANVVEDVTPELRRRIALTANCVAALDRENCVVSVESVSAFYAAASAHLDAQQRSSGFVPRVSAVLHDDEVRRTLVRLTQKQLLLEKEACNATE